MKACMKAEWAKINPDHDSDIKSAQKMMSRLTESLISANNKVFNDVVYQTLGRPYDNIDLANFMIEVGVPVDGWKVFYKGIELGTIKSNITNDYKCVVEFCPVGFYLP